MKIFLWTLQIKTSLQQFHTFLNGSGLARKTVCAIDAAVQCDERDVDAIGQLEIHIGAHNCTKCIKSTCAKVPVKCNISTECSRIAVKQYARVSTITY